MTFTSLIFLAGLLYGISFVLASMEKSSGLPVRICASAGFAFHSMGLLAIIWSTDSLPVGRSYELIESISWIFILTQLVLSKGFKVAPIGLFSMLPAAILTLLPIACPVFAEGVINSARRSSNFAAVHGMLAAISYAFMMASAVAGLMYFQQKKFLREKSHNAVSRALPPLGALERSVSATLGTSTLIMFASAIIGIVSAFKADLTPQMVFKFCVGALVLILQAAVYFSVALKIIGGARLAKAAIALAAVALLLLIPIEIGI